jgi:hypothetical protein
MVRPELTKLAQAAKALGRLALGRTFIAGEFSLELARRALRDLGWTEAETMFTIYTFRDNGVLSEGNSGVTSLRFVLAPIAEYFAAHSYLEEGRRGGDCWSDLLLRTNGAPGFQERLRLVRAAEMRKQQG